MPKLQDVVAKAMADVQPELNVAVAKSVGTAVSKPSGTIAAPSLKSMTVEQLRALELGVIAKQVRGGNLSAADLSDLAANFKAVGGTGDYPSLLPAGFTGALIQDIQAELNVAKLFPMKMIKGGTAYDQIARHGITAYLTAEEATGTDSQESYMTFVATTQKVMAIVRKSYELLDDSLIDIASEVRAGLVRAITEAVETTVVNGDLAGTMDAGTAANSAIRVSNGLRRTGLSKHTVDFGGSTYTEETFLAKINEMQLAGGVYLDERAVARGDVALIVDQYTYANIRKFPSFKTIDVAGRMATLFGGKVSTIFGIPVVVTSSLPAVDATGVVNATPGNNTLSTCVMVNIATFRVSANGSVIAEMEKNITSQTYVWTASFRYGTCSLFDSESATPNTINATIHNVVAGINMAR